MKMTGLICGSRCAEKKNVLRGKNLTLLTNMFTVEATTFALFISG